MIRRTLSAIVLALLAASAATAPVLLQQPFGAQTPAGLAVAHAMRQWGATLTVALALAVVWLVLPLVRRVRWWGGALLGLPIVLALAAAWFARQNAFEWMFNRVERPQFAAVRDASFVEPNDLVLAVNRDGDAAAYPIRLIAYHHIVNDRIGRTPAVVTY